MNDTDLFNNNTKSQTQKDKKINQFSELWQAYTTLQEIYRSGSVSPPNKH